MITEIQARKKWCPMARTIAGNGGTGLPDDPLVVASGNRTAQFSEEDPADPNPETSRCIASACMAWRWAEIDDYRFPDDAPIGPFGSSSLEIALGYGFELGKPFRTVGELRAASDEDLLLLPHVGPATLRKLRALLAQRNVDGPPRGFCGAFGRPYGYER